MPSKNKSTTEKLSLEALTLVAHKFKVLSDPARLQILQELKESEKSGKELIELTGLSQPTLSKHLKVLFESQIVKKQQDGSHVYFSIRDESVFELCETICGKIKEEINRQNNVFS